KRVENLKTQMKTLSQYANGELASKKVHKRAKPYVSFVFRVQKAISDCEAMGVIGIKKAAVGSSAEFAKDRNGEIILDDRGKPIQLKAERAANWFAWAWFMERRFPERWSRTDVRDFEGERPEPTLAQGADLDRIRSADKELKELEQFEKRQAKGLPEPIEAEYSVENE
ncbi:MAG: hypothetical protein KJ604_19940, partial [Gammaproteobacteria bacterium]|nr:hypothetical protein [Gammaproteobacteria bacterium]